MRLRDQHTVETQDGLKVAYINSILDKYPLLHAYGIGISVFRNLPPHDRMLAIKYSRYIIYNCLDDEIDCARRFLLLVGANRFNRHSRRMVRASYLDFMYQYYRLRFPGLQEYIPLGCWAIAAILTSYQIKVYPAARPDFEIAVSDSLMGEICNDLELTTKFRQWEFSKTTCEQLRDIGGVGFEEPKEI